MASESPEPPDLNEGGDSPSKSVAPVCKENLDCGGKDALDAPVVAQVTTSGKSEIVVDTTADDSPQDDVGIRHMGPARNPQVDMGLMGGPVGGSLVVENVEEMTMRNTGKRPMTDQEMPSSSSNPTAQVSKPWPSQGEFGKILQISQWSLTHRIQVCKILQDSGQHWRMSIRSRHEYARQSDAIVTSRSDWEPTGLPAWVTTGFPAWVTTGLPAWEPPDPLEGFDPMNWEADLEKLEVEMEKFCFQSWDQLTTDLESKLGTSRKDDEKERWYVACRKKGFQAQEIFQAVEEGNLEAFKTRMEEIGTKYWTLHPREYRGATPLHWAALYGQADMVSFMLEGMQNSTASTDGAGMLEFVNAYDEFGLTPLDMALFPTLLSTYRYPDDLLDIIEERDELAMRCSQMMDSLFNMGATLRDRHGIGGFRIVTADVRDDSRTYFVASSYSDRQCVEYSYRRIIPLALAVLIAHPSLIEKFVHKLKRIAFEPITSNGNVLHLVAMGGSAAFFERGRVMTILLCLSKQYCNVPEVVNFQNRDKRTPLHIAIAWGNHECVAALLKCREIKENVNHIADENGHTPFSIARKIVEMSTKTGLARDMVDMYREHNRKFWDGTSIHNDMPMSNFNCKPGGFFRKDCDDTMSNFNCMPGGFSGKDCDDIATKIFDLMISDEEYQGFRQSEEVKKGIEILKCSNVDGSAKQFQMILQMSQWSLTHRIYVCKLLQKPFLHHMLDPLTRKEYAEQYLSLIKMNLQSDGNTKLFASILEEGLDWEDPENEELFSQAWEELASELECEQYTLREKDTHENWYKAFEGKAFKPYEIFEAVELNLFPLAKWMMKQVTSLLEKDCTGITPGEYRGATPLHWAMLHGNIKMVKLMLEDAFKAKLLNQDDFGFKPIHMAILSSSMDECFLDWNLTDLNSLLHSNNSEHVPAYSNEHAYIGRRFKPYLFQRNQGGNIIDICYRSILGANKVLSPIELAIYIAKEKVVEDLMVHFVGFVKPSNEETLLHFAARGFNSECIAIMNLVLRHLHLQPNMLNSCNNDGEAPLHIAIRQQNKALVLALLRCHYIKVDIPNNNGRIPLQLVEDEDASIRILIENHAQGRRHTRLLQLSQWSLRHRILAIQMFIENENDAMLEMIKDIYMKQCRLVAGGDSSRTGDVAELNDIANKLREELKELSKTIDFRWLQKGYISIEEGDYPINIRSDYEYETRNELDHLLHKYALRPVHYGRPEYTGANWFHWAVLHGRADMVDSICSKLKADIMQKKFVPNSEDGIDKEQETAIRDEFEELWANIVDARDGFGFTPLHLVAFPFPWRSNHMYTDQDGTQKDVELVGKLSENKFPHCASRGPRLNFMLWNCSDDGNDGDCTPYAVDDPFPVNCGIYPIQLALHMVHPSVVEKLLEKFPENCFVKYDSSGNTILHDAEAWEALSKRSGDQWRRIETNLLKLLDSPSYSKAVNVRNNDRDTPLHKAVKTKSLEWVEVILQCEHIKFNLRDREKLTPREVALKMFKERAAKKSACLVSRCIQQWFSNKTPPKESPIERIIELIHTYDPESMPQERETLQRDRQVYVDAANAILVGAALIASASFGAWLQPPLGYQAYYSPDFQDTSPAAPPETYESYVAIKQHWILQMFWIFNSLAFFFSLATVIAGADAAIPSQETELKKAVDSVRHAVKIASALLGVAIVFVICTFATLGFAILPPIEKYRINMWCTLAVGVVVCSVMLIRLLRKLVLSGSQITGSAKPTLTAQITELS